MMDAPESARGGKGSHTCLLTCVALLLAGALAGCAGSSDDDAASPTPVPGDLDGDGFSPATGDCKESDSSVYPGAEEVCNGKDDDCDDDIDPGCDQDGDGYLGTALGGQDCDDTAAAIHPGALETCNTIDDNCDGQIDNAIDQDGDGFGPCAGESTPADCSDVDPAIYPGALEILDGTVNDCDATGEAEVIAPAGAGASLVGEYAGDGAGSRVAAAGDLNGDGIPDLVIGAPAANPDHEDAGKVYLLFGGEAGALKATRADHPSSIDLSYADVTLAGTAEGDLAGSFVSGVGDVDGDGIDDLWIGAPGANLGAGTGYLVLGRESWPSTYFPLAQADGIFEGPTFDAAIGPASGGDADGDGVADLLIGAPGQDGETGAAYLYFGGGTLPEAGDAWTDDALPIVGDTPGALTGTAVSLENDVDSDGLHDLVISAPGVGQAWVLLSREGEWTPKLSDAKITLTGSVLDLAGLAISFASDLNHDGYRDLAIGAPGTEGSAGTLYLVLGKPSALQAYISLDEDADFIFQGAANAQLGAAIGAGGDVNGDGVDDLVVGAPGSSTAWLLPGWYDRAPSSGPIADAAIASFVATAGTGAGASQAIVGDLNGDGAAEWVIGAPLENTGGAGAGMVYLLFGYRL